ncbi:terminase gpP N-terminus-related DNA-binding protein [Xanthobacter sp. AM11]|uniref:terminase gpP N-terminus-related DNA-binding protein n=1 Tax=Xanthobacter sp. AM11 TaxID=3380643 RepID=UPI0039BFD602
MRKPSPPRRAPAQARLARQLYLEGLPLAQIAARTGLSPGSVYYWIDREVAADGTVTLAPVCRRLTLAPGARAAAPARGHLLARLWRAAERQLDEIEERLARAMPAAGETEAAAPRAAGDAEKDARALAVLARTLRELSALEAEARKTRKAEAEHDTVRDLDAFRRELARRLDRLRADGAGAEPAQ